MISRLKGIIDAIDEDSAIIDVGGVGYLIFASSKTLSSLAIGQEACVEIETHVREDHIHLFGFANAGEREWFRLLTSVQGVGTKVGLALVGLLSPNDLHQAVAAADKLAFTRAPGVGPKLANRILSELTDKVDKIGWDAMGRATHSFSLSQPATPNPPTAAADAASALVNLGYGPSEAFGAISRVVNNLGGDAGVEVLIQGGLKELANE